MTRSPHGAQLGMEISLLALLVCPVRPSCSVFLLCIPKYHASQSSSLARPALIMNLSGSVMLHLDSLDAQTALISSKATLVGVAAVAWRIALSFAAVIGALRRIASSTASVLPCQLPWCAWKHQAEFSIFRVFPIPLHFSRLSLCLLPPAVFMLIGESLCVHLSRH